MSRKMVEAGDDRQSKATQGVTTQTTTLSREWYYGVVIPYLARRAAKGLPATWNWLSVEAVERFIQNDPAATDPGKAPEGIHQHRRRGRTVVYGGEEHTPTEWAVLTGIPRYTIVRRMKRGWPAWKILEKEDPDKDGGMISRSE